MNKRILLIGHGQLAWELSFCLATLGEVVIATIDDPLLPMDLAKPDMIRDCIRAVRPDIIVNAAAYTAVDQAEKDAEKAALVNADAPGIIAEEAQKLGAILVHYSTDYVFSGDKNGAYTEDDTAAPRSVYGTTKHNGDRNIAAVGGNHLILRISWVYGLRCNNFLQTMLRLFASRDELSIVNDQWGIPMWTRSIALMTTQILTNHNLPDTAGVYHLGGEHVTNWFEFAERILALSGMTCYLQAIPTEQYPTLAQRPKNSHLSNSKLKQVFGLQMPEWDQALTFCMHTR